MCADVALRQLAPDAVPGGFGIEVGAASVIAIAVDLLGGPTDLPGNLVAT
jgi:hypothetical protein